VYLLSGAAGFIGFHLAHTLLAQGEQVLGVDNLNDYYDVGLKRARLEHLASTYPSAFAFRHADVTNVETLAALRSAARITRVAHLAGQPGLRQSMADPLSHVRDNVIGQATLLGWCRTLPALEHVVYTSSSSVYGAGAEPPFTETSCTDHPLSVYASSKRSAELLADCFVTAYGLPVTGVRLFTVYGPWGRPDMAYFTFTRQILAGQPIRLHNGGRMRRDFTYVEDAVSALVGLLRMPGVPSSHRIFNLGSGRAEPLVNLVKQLEELLGVRAIVEHSPIHPGEREETCADITRLHEEIGFTPQIRLPEGLSRFVDWYRRFYP
jgi:UDP-glucuronate 4-epimerase